MPKFRDWKTKDEEGLEVDLTGDLTPEERIQILRNIEEKQRRPVTREIQSLPETAELQQPVIIPKLNLESPKAVIDESKAKLIQDAFKNSQGFKGLREWFNRK